MWAFVTCLLFYMPKLLAKIASRCTIVLLSLTHFHTPHHTRTLHAAQLALIAATTGAWWFTAAPAAWQHLSFTWAAPVGSHIVSSSSSGPGLTRAKRDWLA